MNYKNKYYKYKLKYLTLKKIIGGTNPHDEAASDALVKLTKAVKEQAAAAVKKKQQQKKQQ